MQVCPTPPAPTLERKHYYTIYRQQFVAGVRDAATKGQYNMKGNQKPLFIDLFVKAALTWRFSMSMLLSGDPLQRIDVRDLITSFLLNAAFFCVLLTV